MREPLGYLLKRAQGMLRANMDAALEAHGLTTPQYAVMTVLADSPRVSSAELARRSFVTPQTMIRIVETLEGRGLIFRQPHATHGRVLMASLTAAGSTLLASCQKDVEAADKDMWRCLTVTERATIQELLSRCIAFELSKSRRAASR